jgi:hypothetical protein
MDMHSVLFEKRREPLPIAVVAVIGGISAKEVDQHFAAKAAGRFKQDVRRFRHHQAAEEAESQ